MRTYDVVGDFFDRMGWKWSFDEGLEVPAQEDVDHLLDEAARTLADEPIGTQLQVGRLIIIKTETGFHVYGFLTSYY